MKPLKAAALALRLGVTARTAVCRAACTAAGSARGPLIVTSCGPSPFTKMVKRCGPAGRLTGAAAELVTDTVEPAPVVPDVKSSVLVPPSKAAVKLV